MLMRIIKRYTTRIQKSVFEAYLKPVQLKEMTDSIEKLMSSELYFNPDDNIRIYRIATNCTATIFGSCNTVSDEDDIFI
jgi:CRISPR-associated endonuclease Cas2